MARKILRVLMAIGLVGVAGGALAETKAGPLLQLRVEGRQESDLDGTHNGGSMVLQPSLGFWVDSPTTQADAAYSVDLRGYPGGAQGGMVEVPTPNHRLLANQELQLNPRLTVKLREHGELVGEPTSLSRLGVARSFGETTWLNGEAEVHDAITRTDSLTLGWDGNLSRFEDPALEDGMVNSPFVWGRRAITARDAVGIKYQMQIFDDVNGPGAISHEPGLTYERALAKAVHLELGAGPAFVSQGQESFQLLPHGRAALRYDSPYTTLSTAVERAFLGATGFPGAVWSDVATAGLTHRFDEAWAIRVGAGVYRNGSGPTGGPAVMGALTASSVEYQFAPGLAASLSWRMALQQEAKGVSDGLVPSLQRNIFAAGLTWGLDGGRVPR